VAKVLKKYEPSKRPGPEAKYPWNDWFDGQIWQITQEEDFPDSTVASMEDLIRKTAKQYGYTVSVFKEGDDTLVIRPREE